MITETQDFGGQIKTTFEKLTIARLYVNSLLREVEQLKHDKEAFRIQANKYRCSHQYMNKSRKGFQKKMKRVKALERELRKKSYKDDKIISKLKYRISTLEKKED